MKNIILTIAILLTTFIGNSQPTESYYTRGLAKDNLGDYIGAIADYNKAIELNPHMQMLIITEG
jgi:tetratricopeptide (TPR) repeat protein